MEEFIVAEITKSWTKTSAIEDLIGHKFEHVINFNLKRGYDLYEWKLTSFVDNEILTETIIAIFKKTNEQNA